MMTRQRRAADGGRIALLGVATVGGMVALGLASALMEQLSTGPLGRVPALVPSLWRGHATGGSGSARPSRDVPVVDLAAAGRVRTP